MYAAVRQAKTNPGAMSEVLRRLETEFLPMINTGMGLVQYYAIDAGNDNVVTVSVFESQEAAEKSNSMAQSWVKEVLAPLMAGPLDTKVGNVTVHMGG